jgi:hypothetical protein
MRCPFGHDLRSHADGHYVQGNTKVCKACARERRDRYRKRERAAKLAAAA